MFSHIKFDYDNKKIFFSITNEKDHIQHSILSCKNFYESDLLEFLGSITGPEDTIVDIGSNIGNHVVFFARVKSCNVISIEPCPENFDLQRQNIELNGIEEKVELHNVALSDNIGKCLIVSEDEYNCGKKHIDIDPSGNIEVLTLDSLLLGKRVSILKIDTEGCELPVLRGGMGIIAEQTPIIVAEATTSHDLVNLSSFLLPLGYQGVSIFCHTTTVVYVHPTHKGYKKLVSIGEILSESRLKDVLQRVEGNRKLALNIKNNLLDSIVSQQKETSLFISQLLERHEKALAFNIAESKTEVVQSMSLVEKELNQSSNLFKIQLEDLYKYIGTKLHDVECSSNERIDKLVVQNEKRDRDVADSISSIKDGDNVASELYNAQLEDLYKNIGTRLQDIECAFDSGIGRLVFQNEKRDNDILQSCLSIEEGVNTNFEIYNIQLEGLYKDIETKLQSVELSLDEKINMILFQHEEKVKETSRIISSIEKEVSAGFGNYSLQSEELRKHFIGKLQDITRFSDKRIDRLMVQRVEMDEEVLKSISSIEQGVNSRIESCNSLIKDLYRHTDTKLQNIEDSFDERLVSFISKSEKRENEVLQLVQKELAELRKTIFKKEWKRLGHEAKELRDSISFQIGQAFVDIAVHPISGSLKFIPRVLGQAYKYLRKEGGTRLNASSQSLVDGSSVSGIDCNRSSNVVSEKPSRVTSCTILKTEKEAEQHSLVSMAPPSGAGSSSSSNLVSGVASRVASCTTLKAKKEMGQAPLVSVVMTTYNSESTIRKSIESILNQTYKNLELIVVDDCSSDSTPQILVDFANNNNNVIVKRNTINRGTYWSKNFGISISNGGLVSTNDSDDTSDPKRIEKQVNIFLNNKQVVLCSCNYVRVDETGKIILNRGLKERLSYQSLMWIKEEILNKYGYFDSVRFAADDEFYKRLKIELAKNQMYHLNEPLYLALHREGSLTQSDSSSKIELTHELQLPPDRQAYVHSYSQWHMDEKSKGKTIFMPYPCCVRKFPIPSRMATDVVTVNRVVASVASIPQRIKSFELVVEKILPQVDNLYVYLNNYKEIPEFLKNKKIIVARSQDHGDLADNGKFFFINEIRNCIHLTIDDDINYPDDYVLKMVMALQVYGYKAIVGAHGVVLPSPMKRFYEGRYVSSFRLAQENDKFVSLLGTGALCYYTGTIEFDHRKFTTTRMVDLWVAIEAKNKKVPMVSITRESRWIDDLCTGGTSIYEEHVKNDDVQTRLAVENGPWGFESYRDIIRPFYDEILKDIPTEFIKRSTLDFETIYALNNTKSKIPQHWA